MSYIGIDIGGTKCAVVRGEGSVIEEKHRFATTDVNETIKNIISATEKLMRDDVVSIGISCGGPLDSKKGIIQAPPNLPDWDNIHITYILNEKFGVPAYLCNDADACALAEWQCGAGMGSENMIFLTFGTGFGAGLILNGRLYSGTCGMAGEIGHVSLYEGENTHTGYYKKGAVEGYCSGGGIAQYGMGSARDVQILAEEGNEDAINLYKKVGEDLGKTLAILVDILNPERIVIGSIFVRAQSLIEESMNRLLSERALAQSVRSCKVVPAELGESIGDVAALTVAKLGGQGYAV